MTTLRPPPSASLPLSLLRERARSLNATAQDIDALLAAMVRPVRPGEPLRPRADVLHLIIDDPVMGGLRGSDGRRVDETAAQALVALGAPYAGELSAEGRKVLQNAPPLPTPGDRKELASPKTGRWKLVLGPILMACGLVEMVAVWSWLSSGRWALLRACCVALSILTVTGPGLMLMLSLEEQSRWLYVLLRALVRQVMAIMILLVIVSACGYCMTGGRDKGNELFGMVTLAGVAVRIIVRLCLGKALDDAPPAPGT